MITRLVAAVRIIEGEQSKGNWSLTPISLASKCGYGQTAEPLIASILERVPGAIAQVQENIPPRFPQRVADAILGGLQESARRMEQMPSE